MPDLVCKSTNLAKRIKHGKDLGIEKIECNNFPPKKEVAKSKEECKVVLNRTKNENEDDVKKKKINKPILFLICFLNFLMKVNLDFWLII